MTERLDWINYQHLLYYWTAVKERSVSKAARRLHRTQPTISAQLKSLADAVGHPLFTRTGRTLLPTEIGLLVFRYADEIFSLGRELADTLQDRPSGKPIRLQVGVTDAVPKILAYRALQPALQSASAVHLICREDKPDRLLAELALHGLDLVLCDEPPSMIGKIRAHAHLLGESGVSVFATATIAKTMRPRFPGSLHGAPFLMPSDATRVRKDLDLWFEEKRVRPRVIGEFQDSALIKAFGEGGEGAFIAPTFIESDILRQRRLRLVGRIPKVRERLYAISMERKIQHPAVLAIIESARRRFLPSKPGR
jgi:LysR family transcriptional regulator, transcriptional activator of nhaA